LVLFCAGTAFSFPALSDPDADRIAGWDDSETSFCWITPGTGLSLSGNTLSTTGTLDDIAVLTPDTDASIFYWTGTAWTLAKSLNIDLVLADEDPATEGQITYGDTDNELKLYSGTTVYHFRNTDTAVYDYETIPIAWMQDGTTAPAALDEASSRSPYVYRDFDSAADEDVNFVWKVPSNLSGTVVQYRVYYLITAATGPTSTEGVAFSLAGVSAGDNDATNGTKGTAVTVTDEALDAAQWDIMVTDWSGDVTITDLAAGEVAEINFERTTGDAADTYAQDVGVAFVEIRYSKKPSN